MNPVLWCHHKKIHERLFSVLDLLRTTSRVTFWLVSTDYSAHKETICPIELSAWYKVLNLTLKTKPKIHMQLYWKQALYTCKNLESEDKVNFNNENDSPYKLIIEKNQEMIYQIDKSYFKLFLCFGLHQNHF